MSLSNNLSKILIIDFGSQFTQLIARRVREFGVYSEIISHKKINTNEIINSGIKFPDEYQGYIFDGEYITKLANDSQTKRFYIFDVYYHKEGTRLIPTYNRLWLDSRTKDNDINKGRVKYIDEFMEHYESRQDIPEYSIKIYKKNYQYIAGNAFEAARIKLNQIDSLLSVGISLVPYKTDGLVFLPLKFPVNGMSTTEIVNQHIKQPEDIDNLAQIDEYYESFGPFLIDAFVLT